MAGELPGPEFEVVGPSASPVQQTASIANDGAIAGHGLFPETAAPGTNFHRKASARFLHTFGTKMNCNQNIIRPDINPPANGNQGGHPGLGKLRRKLGLTFVLSNPFKVPVAQSPLPPAAPDTNSSGKTKKKSI
jgi:hypothetical protein